MGHEQKSAKTFDSYLYVILKNNLLFFHFHPLLHAFYLIIETVIIITKQ